MEKINSKFIMFYKTFGGLSLSISKAQAGAYVAITKDGSSSIPKPDLKFPSSKSNCTYGAPNGSKIVFCKGRHFFRDRDTSCRKGDTSSEIQILLVESEILL